MAGRNILLISLSDERHAHHLVNLVTPVYTSASRCIVDTGAPKMDISIGWAGVVVPEVIEDLGIEC